MSACYPDLSTPSAYVAAMPAISAAELKNAAAEVFGQVAPRRAAAIRLQTTKKS